MRHQALVLLGLLIASLVSGCGGGPSNEDFRQVCLTAGVPDSVASIQYTPGVVRVHVHLADGTIQVGTGFVLDRHHVVTAAHVLRPIPTTPHVIRRPWRIQIQEPQPLGLNDRAPVIDATMAVVDPNFTIDRGSVNEEEAFDFALLYFHAALPIRNYTAAAYDYNPPRDCNDCPTAILHTAGTSISGNSQDPRNFERGTPNTRVRQVSAFRAFTRDGTRMIDVRPAWNVVGDSGGPVYGTVPGLFLNHTRIIGVMARRQVENGTPFNRILVLRRDRIQAMQDLLRQARQSFDPLLPDQTVPTPPSMFWNGIMNDNDPLQMRLFQFGDRVDAFNIDAQIQQASLFGFTIEAAGAFAPGCHDGV